MALIFGLAIAAGGAGPAAAQFFFQPFFQSWRYDLPGTEEEIPQYGSRRAVARILAREGYTLMGPLGRRGDQIVATGVSRRDGETRFFIDPFEGRILAVRRLEPAPEGRLDPEDRTASPPPALRDRDIGATRPMRRPARAETGSRRPPAGESPVPETAARTPPAPPPTETQKRIDAARPPDASKPAEIAKPAEPAKIDVTTPLAPPPAPPRTATGEASVKSQPLPARPVAARTTGTSHRAIVPPKAAEGTAAVTPPAPAGTTATAPTATGARTPASASATGTR
jgi:hypothetical protein